MRRLAPLAIVLAVLAAAGCDTSKPGEKTVLPLPTKIVGAVPKAQAVAVPAQYKHGDPVAGKQVFLTAGCTGCHTLADANAHGTVGPNLDTVNVALSKAVTQVVNGGAIMPPFKGRLSTKQLADVAAYIVKVTHGNPNG